MRIEYYLGVQGPQQLETVPRPLGQTLDTLELLAQLINKPLVRETLLGHEALLHPVQPLEELLLAGQTHAALLELPEDWPQLPAALPRLLALLLSPHLA